MRFPKRSWPVWLPPRGRALTNRRGRRRDDGAGDRGRVRFAGGGPARNRRGRDGLTTLTTGPAGLSIHRPPGGTASTGRPIQVSTPKE